MRRKRKEQKKRLILIAVLLLLCVLAGFYAVKLAGKVAENRRAAEAEAQAEAEAAAQQEAEEAAAAEAETTKKSESIYAYSGASGDAKYSLAAYDSAVEAGAGVLAVPFVVSQDGTLYVADDDYAQDLTGYGGYFSGMADAQIDNLETRSGAKVLKLSEVLDKYGKDIHYDIELRYTSERNLMALKEWIDKNDCSDAVSISSRYFSGLRSLDNELPDIPKIFICSSEEEWGEAMIHEFIDAVSVSKDMMSADYCKEAHDRDKKFAAWILSSEEEINNAKEIGADFYYTDEAVLAAGLE